MPVTDIPFAPVDMDSYDPIAAIFESPEFESAVAFFTSSPSSQRSLMSPQAQALLYVLIRVLKPQRVVEIGTFKAGTTEAMARGVLANKTGILETVDPFGRRSIPKILAAWPDALQKTTIFHAVNSMEFFSEMERRHPQADLIFIDGNHDFEFALFDIESAGRFLRPNGLMLIDNIAQPGPFMASRDFLARHRGWREYGSRASVSREIVAFDAERTKIENTEFCILRAPPSIVVDERPMTLGEIQFTDKLDGIQIELAQRSEGTLHIQCVVRTFGIPPGEFVTETSFNVTGEKSLIRIPLDVATHCPPDTRQTVEPWLVWKGEKELRLASPPTIY
jgi:predicted O-methyltransferase YrrM